MSFYRLGASGYLSDLAAKVNGAAPGNQVMKISDAFPGNKIVNVKCHDDSMAILLEDGSLHTFGNADAVGHGRNETRVAFNEPGVFVSYVEIGGTHMFAIDNKRQVYAWGINEAMQLGFSEPLSVISRPQVLGAFTGNIHVVSVAAGYSHSIFLLSDGTIWSTGSNQYGQLGIGNTSHSNGLTQINSVFGIPFVQIVAGYHHSLALTISGTVFAWGRNNMGQLGVGDVVNKSSPNRVSQLKSQKVKYICAGKQHSVALTSDGGVFTFGSNEHGQVGHGISAGEKNVNPRKVFELMGRNVSQVACGKNHTLAFVQTPPQIYSFGDNSSTQLGYSGQEQKNLLPMLIDGPWSASRRPSMPTGGYFSRYFGQDNTMKKVLAGGNATVVYLTGADDGTPLDFRNLENRSKVSHLSERLVTTLADAETMNFGVNRAIETLNTVMSSQSCLNSCFLASDHDKISGSYSGLSMMSVRLAFSKICSSRYEKVTDTVAKALKSRLIPSLSESPPDKEALRLYVFLPECPLLQRPENYASLTYPFARKLIALTKIPSTIINKWYRTLEPMYYLKTLETFKDLLTRILTKPFDFPDHENMLRVVLQVLRKLNDINTLEGKQPLVPYQKFYLQDVARMVNFDEDYVIYRNSSSTPGSKPSFCNYPFLLDSSVKTELLRTDAQYQMRMAFQGAQTRNLASMLGFTNTMALETPRLELEVKRSDIVNNALNQLSQVDVASLKKPLQVKFQGEEGEDAGGVRKEFFMLILKEILDPKYGMFRNYAESRLMWFAEIQIETDAMYFLVGLICGLAIYNNTIIDICFPLALYRKLLGEKVGMSDLKVLDPVMHRSLQMLLDYEEGGSNGTVEDIFGLTFSINKDNFGEAITVDLVPNGQNIDVTGSNRGEYVNQYIEFLFNASVKEQFAAFSEGFLKVCGGHILSLFRPTELMEMVIGNQNYNWDDFEKTAEYKGVFYRQHPVIDRFWSVFHRLTLEDKKDFLLFLTGSNKVPIGGVKIMIQAVSLGDKHLPVAHTCFNLLDLPMYTSRKVLEEKLKYVLNYNQGFHLA